MSALDRATLRPDLAALLAPRRAELCDEMIQSDPRLATIAQARFTAPTALDCREMIPDATLRRLARGVAEMQVGEIPENLQRELSILLPDLCGELLGRRIAMEGPELPAVTG